jgi:hypothetical protein
MVQCATPESGAQTPMGARRVLRIEGGVPKLMKHDCTTLGICIERQRRPCDQVVAASIGAAF